MSDTQTAMDAMFAKVVSLLRQTFGDDPELAAKHGSACPQQMYADLLADGPVRHLRDGDVSLMTMADILYVTRHPSVEQGTKYLGSDRPAIPLGLDGPIHTQYRRLLDPIFTPKAVAPLAENVRNLAGELIDRFLADGHVDAYGQWCEPLPSTIFLSIMGLPMEDRENFIRFKNLALTGAADISLTEEQRMALRNEAVTWIHDYFNASLDERGREVEPRDDIIGRLLSAEIDGHRLTRQDVVDILGLFMIAGLDTVAASLACFLSFFARNPAHRKAVVDDRTKLRPAIEELMRFESPVIEGWRIATDDITLPSGTTVAAEAWMHISWSAANLDPAVFADPLTPDLGRDPNPHIGFASGYHRCLGSHLARMELHTALDVWHERIPDYQLDGDEPLVYSGNPRTPHYLPLAWG